MDFGNLLQILVTAIVQGITEFLPISSSGHLIFINELFSWKDINLTLIVAAHLGTLFAVINYFWEDCKKYFLLGPLEIFNKNKTFRGIKKDTDSHPYFCNEIRERFKEVFVGYSFSPICFSNLDEEW